MKEQLIHMQQILKEREEQYEERDAEFKERVGQLKLLGDKLLQQRNDLIQKEKELTQMKAYVDQDVAAIKMEQQLELEQIKNERIKIEREKEGLIYENILKKGEANADIAPQIDHSKYVLRSDHDEEVKVLRVEIDRLRDEKEYLEQEKASLLEHLTKDEWSESDQEQVITQPNKLHLPEEVWSEINKEEDYMTPQALFEHLQGNNKFSEVECRKEEVGEVVRATRKGLQYRFVFSKPPCVFIYALRKNGRGLRKAFAELSKQYPHIQFTHQEDRAVAQMFFTKSSTVLHLMQEVDRISSHFAESA